MFGVSKIALVTFFPLQAQAAEKREAGQSLFRVLKVVLVTETRPPRLFQVERADMEVDPVEAPKTEVRTSARYAGRARSDSAHSYYSVRAASDSGTPRLYQSWFYQFGCTKKCHNIHSTVCSVEKYGLHST